MTDEGLTDCDDCGRETPIEGLSMCVSCNGRFCSGCSATNEVSQVRCLDCLDEYESE